MLMKEPLHSCSALHPHGPSCCYRTHPLITPAAKMWLFHFRLSFYLLWRQNPLPLEEIVYYTQALPFSHCFVRHQKPAKVPLTKILHHLHLPAWPNNNEWGASLLVCWSVRCGWVPSTIYIYCITSRIVSQETEESKNFKRFSNTSQLREPPGRNLFSLHEDGFEWDRLHSLRVKWKGGCNMGPSRTKSLS